MTNFQTQLAETIAQLAPYIRYQAKSYASRACTADDIAQDVYVLCATSPVARSLTERPEELKRFVMRVSKRHATAVGRSARRKSTPQPLTEALLATIPADSLGETIDDDSAATLASQLFDQLTHAAKLALWLAVETRWGKTQAQLAVELGMSARTVQRYMALRVRGTSNLRQFIERLSDQYNLTPKSQDVVCDALLKRLHDIYPDANHARALLQDL